MKFVKYTFIAVITVICTFMALQKIDYALFWDSLLAVDYVFLLLFLPVFVLNMILRVIRWKLLFPSEKQSNFKILLHTLLIGNFYNSIFPARAGDFIRAHLLGIYAKLSRMQTLVTIIVERMLDLCFASIVMLILVTYFALPNFVHTGALIFTLASMGILLAGLCIANKRTCGFIKKFVPKRLPNKWLERFKATAEIFIYDLQLLVKAKKVVLFLPVFLLIWILEWCGLGIIMTAANVDFSVTQVICLFLFPTLASIIPGPPGQIGIFEYAVIMGAEILGLDNGPITAVLWHSLSLFYIIISGCLAYYFNKRQIKSLH